MEYNSDSRAVLKYRDNATETIDLNTVKCELTRKNGKAYLPMDSAPPIYPLKEVRKAVNMLGHLIIR